MSDVEQVEVIPDHIIAGFAAVKTDGSLWYYSEYEDGYKTPTKIMDGVSRISASPRGVAAVKSDGTLWMWGDNDYGCVGNGSTEAVLSPVKILDNVVDMDCGGYGNSGAAALKSDGSVWAWGQGPTGSGWTTAVSSPQQIFAGLDDLDRHRYREEGRR